MAAFGGFAHSVATYEANDPGEDSYSILTSGKISLYTVLDGHGGSLAANYAAVHLPRMIVHEVSRLLSSRSGSEHHCEANDIAECLQRAFCICDEAILTLASDEDESISKVSKQRKNRVGTCVVVLLVIGEVYFTANCGDCRAVLCRKIEEKARTPSLVDISPINDKNDTTTEWIEHCSVSTSLRDKHLPNVLSEALVVNDIPPNCSFRRDFHLQAIATAHFLDPITNNEEIKEEFLQCQRSDINHNQKNVHKRRKDDIRNYFLPSKEEKISPKKSTKSTNTIDANAESFTPSIDTYIRGILSPISLVANGSKKCPNKRNIAFATKKNDLQEDGNARLISGKLAKFASYVSEMKPDKVRKSHRSSRSSPSPSLQSDKTPPSLLFSPVWNMEIMSLTSDHCLDDPMEVAGLKALTVDSKPTRPSWGDQQRYGKHAIDRVAGSLSVSRALGDGYLKVSSMSELDPAHLPYITCFPLVTARCVHSKDIAIVIASDGFWNFIGMEEVAFTLSEWCRCNRSEGGNCMEKIHQTSPSRQLLEQCQRNAATDAGMTVESLLELPSGSKKRSILDDITIIVLFPNLSNAVES